MKHIFILLTGAFAALTVASCGKQESVLPGNNAPENNRRVAVRFTAGGLDVQPAAMTRGAWNISDGEIGITVLDETGQTTVDGLLNIGYRYDGTQQAFLPFGEPIYFPTDGSKRRFAAYFPHRELENGIYKVDLSDQPARDQQHSRELLWTGPTEPHDKTTPTVSLEFNHQFAKLVVTVTNGTGLTKEELTGTVVTVTDMHLRADFNVTTGEMTPTDEPGILTLREWTTDGTGHTALVLPAESAASRKMVFTLGSDAFTWNIPQKRFEAGKTYEYTATVNRTPLGITATIADWEEGESDNGIAE